MIPVHDNLLVKIERPKTGEQKTQSGIIIAKTQIQEKESVGTVFAVGTGRYLSSGALIPSCVKAGDKIMFNKFAGTEIDDGENLLVLIKENDILAIIN